MPLPLDELVDVIPDEPEDEPEDDDEVMPEEPDEPEDDDSPDELAPLEDVEVLLEVLVPGSSVHAPSAKIVHDAMKTPVTPR
jgi:hypothetical protein